ncbi:hypothetical protein DFH09DRAFT_1291466 [Mycena vulgaris]|nr:hypothetical protein DFH09DRAFT_1291466 [Mycena vulgaris]
MFSSFSPASEEDEGDGGRLGGGEARWRKEPRRGEAELREESQIHSNNCVCDARGLGRGDGGNDNGRMEMEFGAHEREDERREDGAGENYMHLATYVLYTVNLLEKQTWRGTRKERAQHDTLDTCKEERVTARHSGREAGRVLVAPAPCSTLHARSPGEPRRNTYHIAWVGQRRRMEISYWGWATKRWWQEERNVYVTVTRRGLNWLTGSKRDLPIRRGLVRNTRAETQKLALTAVAMEVYKRRVEVRSFVMLRQRRTFILRRTSHTPRTYINYGED